MICERVNAGLSDHSAKAGSLDRAADPGPARRRHGILKVAGPVGVGAGTVQRVKREVMAGS